MLHHGDWCRASERKVRGKQRIDTRHMSQLDGVTPVRIVQRLVGEQTVDLRVFDCRVVEACLDSLEVERVCRGVGTLSDERLTYSDNTIFPADIPHRFSPSHVR
jgi:hypothetical protein